MISIIKTHLYAIADGKGVRPNKDSYSLIKKQVNFLKAYVIENPIDIYDNKLLSMIVKVIFNWNNNTVKSKEIEIDLKTVDRMMTQHMSIMESISIQKILLDRLKKYQYYEPKSLDLSRHYLEILNKENKC